MSEFLLSLRDRGLNINQEILFIVDGGKGLHKGVREVMGDKAIIQRCQWHKRENVVSHLDELCAGNSSGMHRLTTKLLNEFNTRLELAMKIFISNLARQL